VVSRLRASVVVVLLLLTFAGLSGLAASAGAETRTLTVATHDLVPFVSTHDGVKSGFTIDLLEEIAKREGWGINYVDVKDVGEQLKAVADGRADAAAGAVSITAGRTQNFDFSQPTLNGGMQILVPAGKSETSLPGVTDFLKLLFSKSMLVWLLAALIITVIPAHIT